MNFSYSSFYKSLLKSSLDLEARSHIASLVAGQVCSNDLNMWTQICSLRENYSSPLSQLSRLGFLPISVSYAAGLVNELVSLPSRGYAQPASGGRTETEYLENVSSLPSVKKLIADKNLFSLVSLYLGAPASVYSTEAWWQYPMGADHVPSNAQLWHRDRDDFSFLKLFMYCTDVDDTSGPHAFLPETHISNSSLKLFDADHQNLDSVTGASHQFLTDFDLEKLSYSGSKQIWYGPPGTCFLEDTSGLHRAFVPSHKARLIFSVVWTVGPGFNPSSSST